MEVQKSGTRFIYWDVSELQKNQPGTLRMQRNIEKAMRMYAELLEKAREGERKEVRKEGFVEEENLLREENVLLVPNASKLIPKGYKVAMRHEIWLKAMTKEFEALCKNNTWELVELPEGRKAFPNKWVFDIRRGAKLLEAVGKKEMEPGALFKARLVTRRDLQKEGVDFKETFAPVVKFVTFRVLMTYVRIHDLEWGGNSRRGGRALTRWQGSRSRECP